MDGKEETKKLSEELELLKEKNTLLEEQLELEKTSWLFSHHSSYSIFLGIIYSVPIEVLIYFLEYSLSTQVFYTGPIRFILFFFVYFVIPVIAMLPPIILLKAPMFVYNSLLSYLLSVFFFGTLIFYMDPMQRIVGLSTAVSLAALQGILVGFGLIFVPQFAKRCGYRLVLSGSAFSFEVDANVDAVSKQLNRLEEDFKVFLDKSNIDPHRLCFTKTNEGKKSVFQFFLVPKEDTTDVVIVAHSIRNDVPMRAEPEEVRRTGRIFMKWLEVSSNFTVHETEKTTMIAEAVEESKKQFYRHPFALPSKRVVVEFLRGHWRSIVTIASIVVAVLSWLLPIR